MEEVDRLSVREVRALKLIAERGPMGLTELSRVFGIPTTTVHGMMLRLQANGLVARDEAKQYEITERGREVLDQVKQLLVVG